MHLGCGLLERRIFTDIADGPAKAQDRSAAHAASNVRPAITFGPNEVIPNDLGSAAWPTHIDHRQRAARTSRRSRSSPERSGVTES